MMTKEVGRQLARSARSRSGCRRRRCASCSSSKLRKLVLHAYRHVPYYRDRMRELGIAPDDIRALDDLPKLPFLTKDDVRKHLYFDIMSDNHDKAEILKVTTSGSTGEPFVCFVDRAQLEFRWAATLRSMEWTGWRFGDRQLRLWHQTLGMSKTQVVREFADALLSRRKFIPAYEMSDETLREFVRGDRGVRAGAARRLRRVVQLPRAAICKSTGKMNDSAQGHHLVGADAARRLAQGRSRRRSAARCSTSTARASSPASPTSARRTRAITSSARATSSRC